MNLKINVDRVRRFGKKMVLYGSISGLVMVSGCSSNDKINKDKEFSYKYDISDRENILATITATDVEGVSRTVKGKNY